MEGTTKMDSDKNTSEESMEAESVDEASGTESSSKFAKKDTPESIRKPEDLGLYEKAQLWPNDCLWVAYLEEYFITYPESLDESKITEEELPRTIRCYYRNCVELKDSSLKCTLVEKARRAFRWHTPSLDSCSMPVIAFVTETLLLEFEIAINERKRDACIRALAKVSKKTDPEEKEESKKLSSKDNTGIAGASHEPLVPSTSKMTSSKKKITRPSESYSDPTQAAFESIGRSVETLVLHYFHADMIEKDLHKAVLADKAKHASTVEKASGETSSTGEKSDPKKTEMTEEEVNRRLLKFIRTLIVLIRASLMLVKRQYATEEFQQMYNTPELRLRRNTYTKSDTDSPVPTSSIVQTPNEPEMDSSNVQTPNEPEMDSSSAGGK